MSVGSMVTSWTLSSGIATTELSLSRSRRSSRRWKASSSSLVPPMPRGGSTSTRRLGPRRSVRGVIQFDEVVRGGRRAIAVATQERVRVGGDGDVFDPDHPVGDVVVSTLGQGVGVQPGMPGDPLKILHPDAPVREIFHLSGRNRRQNRHRQAEPHDGFPEAVFHVPGHRHAVQMQLLRLLHPQLSPGLPRVGLLEQVPPAEIVIGQRPRLVTGTGVPFDFFPAIEDADLRLGRRFGDRHDRHVVPATELVGLVGVVSAAARVLHLAQRERQERLVAESRADEWMAWGLAHAWFAAGNLGELTPANIHGGRPVSTTA